MSRLSISCPHCGNTTRVDLSLNLTTQKCDRCGVRFSSVNTGLAGSREVKTKEPPDWRRVKSGDWEETPASTPHSPNPARPPASRGAWLGVGAALLATAATAVTLALRTPPSSPPVPPVAGTSLAGPLSAQDNLSDTSYEVLRERIQTATSAAQAYLSAQNLDELLPLIQNREALEPRVQDYYGPQGEGHSRLPMPEFTLAPVDRQIYVQHLQSVVISYTTPGQVPRAVALRQNPDGRWLVDWPSAAALNEVPLSQFKNTRETTPRLFRLLGTKDDFFNRAFADHTQWVCLRLADPTGENFLYAYARQGSPAATKILEAPLPKRGSGAPLLLRLRFPPQAPSDEQVEITDFLGLGWVMADPSQEPGFTADTPQSDR